MWATGLKLTVSGDSEKTPDRLGAVLRIVNRDGELLFEARMAAGASVEPMLAAAREVLKRHDGAVLDLWRPVPAAKLV
ncbi:MAG: hypothetical protein JO110_12590 [Acetobacteraceae bacterium]|nr:hypothetical protein [Acetobacteraceae bacterium]